MRNLSPKAVSYIRFIEMEKDVAIPLAQFIIVVSKISHVSMLRELLTHSLPYSKFGELTLK